MKIQPVKYMTRPVDHTKQQKAIKPVYKDSLKCPHCGTFKLRAGYFGSYVCDSCNWSGHIWVA